MDFSSLPIPPALRRALDARGFTAPTPVQVAVLAPEHRAQDLLVSSQTGSGKTVAFGLALAETFLGEGEAFGPAAAPLGLVIAPTRELALQVQRELSWLYAGAGGRVAACVGGMDPRREQRALGEGAHVVVGTPGRLCDHLERKNLRLDALRGLVLDEADEMLDMGFRDELERILSAAPRERRTVLFSATLPRPIADLARTYQRQPARISATPPDAAHQDIEYRAHLIAEREREHAVVNTLRLLEPPSALVFAGTREGVTHLHARLAERGFQAVAISGELTQQERSRALWALRDGRARVLVATDVAARGLDLPEVSLVVHADLPRDAAGLLHRSGRTGRAGRKGIAVLLVPTTRRALAERMMKQAKVAAVWTPVASAESVRALDHGRLRDEIGALAEEPGEEDLAVARELLARRSPLELAAALVRRERARRPSPEEMPETAALRPLAAVRRERPDRDGREKPGKNVEPESGVWFRLNVGREKKADPRWILPLICRRGGVTKNEIGKIVVLPKETRFQIARGAAARFAAAARRPDPKQPGIRIEAERRRSEERA